MSEYDDYRNSDEFKEYQEFIEKEREKERAQFRKETYTEAYVCFRCTYPIGSVFSQLNLNPDLIKNSILEEAFEEYSGNAEKIIDDIKYYSDWVTKELKEGKNNDVEMVDFAYADFNESDEKLDYGYAKQVLRDIISSLSLLLSIEGVSQEKIINTFMKVKIFVNYFNGYILNVLYKEGWEKLLRKTIETMPEGLRKEYAKTMNFRYWIVETLIERGTISEDMLKQELNKIIDYGMKCIEGFRKLEYPCENIASIFPDKYVMAKLSESKNSG